MSGACQDVTLTRNQGVRPMPPFGSRKNRSPETLPVESTPELVEPSAQERYDALLAERAELEASIAGHRAERERLLHQAEVPSLGAITALATQTEAVRLQIEWLDRQLPALQDAIAEERRAQWEQAWQTHVPWLVEAQDRLAAAIAEFHLALHHAHEVHSRARGFGDRVSNTFVRPFPEEGYNRYATIQYLRTVELRQGIAPPPPPSMVVELDVAAGISAAPKFKPRRVPYDLVEQISPIAPMRRVRLLHTVRADNLNIGHLRLREGEEMMFPARAAFALTYAGVGVYTDEETADAATAA